jgi:hypothetical protein
MVTHLLDVGPGSITNPFLVSSGFYATIKAPLYLTKQWSFAIIFTIPSKRLV